MVKGQGRVVGGRGSQCLSGCNTLLVCVGEGSSLQRRGNSRTPTKKITASRASQRFDRSSTHHRRPGNTEVPYSSSCPFLILSPPRRLYFHCRQLVSLFICSFVCRITQKLRNRFSQYSVERWHMGRVRNYKILVVIIHHVT